MAGRPALKNNPFAGADSYGMPCQTKISIRNGKPSVVCLVHPTFTVALHDLCDTDAPAEIARMHREHPDVFK